MKNSDPEIGLQNRLLVTRTRLGLSQRELAQAANITRQTIGGIEAGLYAPSATVALRLAKALGCRVEDLFWLAEDLPTVQATLATTTSGAYSAQGTEAAKSEDERSRSSVSDPAAPEMPAAEAPLRVSLSQIEGRWIARALQGEQAFRTEMIPADGLSSAASDADKSGARAVRLLEEPDMLARTVVVAGCAPALSLWARSAERWQPGLRVHWLHANSAQALQSLARGEVHAAGVHVSEGSGVQDNAPFVRQAVGSRAVALVTLGVWEEGLIVPAGNPKRLQTGADLAQAGVRLINREPGAGSRLLLDELLAREGIAARQIQGYDSIVTGHIAAAQAVQTGQADVGVSVAAVAAVYGLGFVPLRAVRYDLALWKASLDYEPMQQLLVTLRHRWILSQLRALGGYDTTYTGDIRDA